MLQPHTDHISYFSPLPLPTPIAATPPPPFSVSLSTAGSRRHHSNPIFPLSRGAPFLHTNLNLTYSPSAPSLSDQYLHARPAFLPTHSSPSLSMEGSIAEELYSESLQSTKSKLGDLSLSDYRQNRPSGSGVDDLCEDDGSLWGGSDEGLEETTDLDREWQRRHDQFHTIGYRDGLIAGKEAAAQEGFNVGFKQSVSVGYKLGLVRGVSSVLASLPDDLKEKLAGTEENRRKFQTLYESVNSLSTVDALRLFNDDITAQQRVNENTNSQTKNLSKQNSDYGRLRKFYGELEALLPKSPALNLHLHEEQ
ncbi:unnamed protein product [Citrullus colocynthis]|uniref:Essential protein Yae1 N-terminal domain-containing protein n=1 Tax=Citrullus colocynthis TaxID=252529 RepID=A0ABP0YD83_9ROSI